MEEVDRAIIQRFECQTVEDVNEFPRVVIHVECALVPRRPVSFIDAGALRSKIVDDLKNVTYVDSGEADGDQGGNDGSED